MNPEVECLLIELFDLTDEDDAAEVIRERLDVYWDSVSAQDRTLIAGLLADLKMLCDREVALEELQYVAPLDLEEQALTAVKTERWIDVLAAVRGPRSTNLTSAMVARLRSHAWGALGFSIAANRFRKYADELLPGKILDGLAAEVAR